MNLPRVRDSLLGFVLVITTTLAGVIPALAWIRHTVNTTPGLQVVETMNGELVEFTVWADGEITMQNLHAPNLRGCRFSRDGWRRVIQELEQQLDQLENSEL